MPLGVTGASTAFVSALEVPNECFSEFGPIMYGVERQVLEPSPRPFSKMYEENWMTK
jgi:hypothetical protein